MELDLSYRSAQSSLFLASIGLVDHFEDEDQTVSCRETSVSHEIKTQKLGQSEIRTLDVCMSVE